MNDHLIDPIRFLTISPKQAAAVTQTPGATDSLAAYAAVYGFQPADLLALLLDAHVENMRGMLLDEKRQFGASYDAGLFMTAFIDSAPPDVPPLAIHDSILDGTRRITLILETEIPAYSAAFRHSLPTTTGIEVYADSDADKERL